MNEVLADRYEVGALLGTGGMANVYEAHDRLLDRRVALKLLRTDLPEGNGRQSVLSEARAAASFTHPHALAVYDIGRDEHRPFIVMELVEGCSLAELLARRGQLPPEQAVAVAGQTLAALEAAHRRGLVHRDIKPANILLPGCRVPDDMDADTGVKLADFGIAKGIREAAGEMTLAGKVIGTPTYLSPEQVSGRSATPQSDLYSVGVVLYEMLAGRPPFTSESPVGVALAHQQQEPDDLGQVRDDLPAGLVALVHQALHKDPYERYGSAGDMRQALRGWRGGAAGVAPTLVDRPVAAAAEPRGWAGEEVAPFITGRRPSRMAGWRPIVIVASVALLAVALISLISALTGGDPEASVDDAAATEQVADAEPTQPPAVEGEDGEAAQDPADEEPADEDGGGFALPDLPDVSLPDPADIGAEQLRDVVGQLPDAVVGERRNDLRSGLDEVAEAPENARPQEAGDLLSRVREWVGDGELNEQIGGFVETVLSRLAGG